MNTRSEPENKNKVSEFLRERKLLKHVKKQTDNHFLITQYQGKVIDATSSLFNKMYDRLIENPSISLNELFAPVPKKKKK